MIQFAIRSCRFRLEWLEWFWWNPIIRINSRSWEYRPPRWARISRGKKIKQVTVNGVHVGGLRPFAFASLFGWGFVFGFVGGVQPGFYSWYLNWRGQIKRLHGEAIQTIRLFGRIRYSYSPEEPSSSHQSDSALSN